MFWMCLSSDEWGLGYRTTEDTYSKSVSLASSYNYFFNNIWYFTHNPGVILSILKALPEKITISWMSYGLFINYGLGVAELATRIH